MFRLATTKDIIRLIRSIQNKKIDYITTTFIKLDVECQRLFVLEIDNKIVGMVSLVEEKNFGYVAIKRLIIFNKKNHKKGYAKTLLLNLTNLNIDNLGATPWNTNVAMKKLLENLGFKYQYNFKNNWEFYKKTLDKC